MALPVDQSMWIAYLGEVRRVTIVQKGTGGTRFKKGTKPRDPYVVYDEVDDEEFVMSSDDLHHNPRDAQIAAAELQKKHGLVSAQEDYAHNPLEPSDDEEEEPEEEEEGDEDD